MNITRFVTVTQRRPLTADEALFPLLERLFEIETHMSMEERILLLQAALSLPMGFVACEIGSYVGASTCFLATAAAIRHGHLHCVDTWDNRAMGFEVPRDTHDEFLRNVAPYRQFLTIHRGVSSDRAGDIPAGLDLLFVDGDHDYEPTRSDLFNYGPKLKSDALLALHDFTHETVERACREYLATRAAQPAAGVQSLQIFKIS